MILRLTSINHRKLLKLGNVLCFFSLLVLMVANFAVAYAYEVNTHQAMTRCAISYHCSSTGEFRAKNLYDFVHTDADLDTENYRFEVYPNTGFTFIGYAMRGEDNFKKHGVSLDGSYQGMIEAGSILEDALWAPSIHLGDGRFVSAFYDPQQGGMELTDFNLFLPDHTDAVTWATKGDFLIRPLPLTPLPLRINDYSKERALDHFRDSFSLTLASERKTAQAKLFVSLGQLSHLVQDLHSTAHTRNDNHGLGDPLEVYGGGAAGFHLNQGKFDGFLKDQIISDTKLFSAINLSNYEEFFKSSAEFASENFFSSGTIFPSIGFSHPLPSLASLEQELVEETIPTNPPPPPGFNPAIRKYYLNSNSPDVSPRKLAIQRESELFFDFSIQTYDDESVLQDNARNLIPRAIASTEGFLNYFFRGRIAATITPDGDGIEIENVSDSSLVQDTSFTTFLAGGQFEVFYEPVLGERMPLLTLSNTALGTNMEIDGKHTITGLSAALQGISGLDSDSELTILFDGMIGNERGLATTHVPLKPLEPSPGVPQHTNFTITYPNIEILPLRGSPANNGHVVLSFTTGYSFDLTDAEIWEISYLYGYDILTKDFIVDGYNVTAYATRVDDIWGTGPYYFPDLLDPSEYANVYSFQLDLQFIPHPQVQGAIVKSGV